LHGHDPPVGKGKGQRQGKLLARANVVSRGNVVCVVPHSKMQHDHLDGPPDQAGRNGELEAGKDEVIFEVTKNVY
jgi:hypothetical protein